MEEPECEATQGDCYYKGCAIMYWFWNLGKQAKRAIITNEQRSEQTKPLDKP